MNSWDKGLNVLPSPASRWASVLNRCRKRRLTSPAILSERRADYHAMAKTDTVAAWIDQLARRLDVDLR